MDIVNGKIFHQNLPEMLRRKLKKMSFQQRQNLLKELENPDKKTGVLIQEYNIFFEAIDRP